MSAWVRALVEAETALSRAFHKPLQVVRGSPGFLTPLGSQDCIERGSLCHDLLVLPHCLLSATVGGHDLSRNSLEINTALLPFYYTRVAMWSGYGGGLPTLFKLAILGELGCECRAPDEDVLVGIFVNLT